VSTVVSFGQSREKPENLMNSAIIGFGAVGQALARAFARKNIPVAVAARRAPEALAPQARAIGPTVTARSLQDALKAQIVILAVPFGLHNELAKAADWHGKIVIDATNAYGISPEELGGLPASVVNAQALVGSRLVKAFNHLPARTLAQDPDVKGGRRVTFFWRVNQGRASEIAKKATTIVRVELEALARVSLWHGIVALVDSAAAKPRGSPEQTTDQVKNQQSNRKNIGHRHEYTRITCNSMVRTDTS
jgi:predicted dinucleotide-binding enzyme